MPKRKRDLHRGHGGRKRRKEAQERDAAKKEAKAAADEQPETLEGDFIPFYFDNGDGDTEKPAKDSREFFGMLNEEEQEQFREFDEELEKNEFETPEEHAYFLQEVFKEAKGKELKLASSQSCSRLMERLILLSTTSQKKSLFDAFANHFPTLVRHRFGSHCCEQLFLQSAPVVTQELGGIVVDDDIEMGGTGDADGPQQPPARMEELFLLALDELEDQLSSLLTDVFGSHALRVMLMVLSGRPLDQLATKSLLQSKRKENISVPGAWSGAAVEEGNLQLRPVPESFNLAVQKIIADTTSTLDSTALGVMVKHPTGNPILQLLLELDITLNTKKPKDRKKKDEANTANTEEQADEPKTLLERLLPDAPASLADDKSEASIFVNAALYDPIASRLLETLINNCPGRIFKAVYTNLMKPRLEHLLRNETATFCVMRALVRLSKEDLADAVERSLPRVEMLLQKGRYNILATLFERCEARNAKSSTEALIKALTSACVAMGGSLVRTLCHLDDEEQDEGESKKHGKKSKKGGDALADPPKKKEDLVWNGCKLATTLIGIPGAPAQAVQVSLLYLDEAKLLQLATSSAATSRFLAAALATPSSTPMFHKRLVAPLIPHAVDLALSDHGHRVICAVVTVPSHGDSVALPFFMKQSIAGRLAAQEHDLLPSGSGRKVWQAWKGDLWARRRSDWVRWAKEVEPEDAKFSKAPVPVAKEDGKRGFGADGGRRSRGPRKFAKKEEEGHSIRQDETADTQQQAEDGGLKEEKKKKKKKRKSIETGSIDVEEGDPA